MKSIKVANYIVARLDDGDDIFSSLESLKRKYKFNFGVVSGIGMLRDVALGYFVGKGKYKRNKYKSIFEIASLSGSISQTKGKEIKSHLHVVLSKKNKKTIGGHLLEGKVNNTLELIISIVNSQSIYRVFNKKTNLFGLEMDT